MYTVNPRLKPAIFMDRDGLINKKIEDSFVLKWEEFEFMPDAIEALKLLYSTTLPLFVVSNQLCINARLAERNVVRDIMCRAIKKMSIGNNHITAWMICPHTKEEHCSCRKPQPGLLYCLARDYNICLEDSYMIGDSESDIQAGYNAKIKNRLWINPELLQKVIASKDIAIDCITETVICKSFLSAAKWVVENERRKSDS